MSSAHLNAQSKFLTLSFLHAKLFIVIDLNEKDKIHWSLPILASAGIPLTMTSDVDKLLVAYDSNKVGVFDLINKQLHPWTVKNISKFPKNFLSRYNRFIGATKVSDSKFLLYTNYTHCVLDMD